MIDKIKVFTAMEPWQIESEFNQWSLALGQSDTAYSIQTAQMQVQPYSGNWHYVLTVLYRDYSSEVCHAHEPQAS